MTKTSYELLQRTLHLKGEVNKLERDIEMWYHGKTEFKLLFANMPSHELDEMAIVIKRNSKE